MNKVYPQAAGQAWPDLPASTWSCWCCGEQDGLILSDIGKRLFLDSATRTPLLKRLEAAGLISRTRAEHDERQVVIALHRRGQGAAQAPGDAEVPYQVFCATACTPQGLQQLKGDLEQLRGHLAEYGRKAAPVDLGRQCFP